MTDDIKALKYRVTELERQVKGVQRQQKVADAVQRTTQAQNERRLRDLEIKAAVQRGVPQKEVAEIFEISRSRVSQISKSIYS
jgi:predicted XRE-type DNA-binding protein